MQIELFLLIGVLHGNRIKLSPFSLHSTVCFKLINKMNKIFIPLHNQGEEKDICPAIMVILKNRLLKSIPIRDQEKIQISNLNEQGSYI